jgi:hypothetical protein
MEIFSAILFVIHAGFNLVIFLFFSQGGMRFPMWAVVPVATLQILGIVLAIESRKIGTATLNCYFALGIDTYWITMACLPIGFL